MKSFEYLNQQSQIKLVVMILTGAIIGFSLQKSQVFVPSIFLHQFSLDQFLMLKLFFAMAATSAFVQTLMLIVDKEYFDSTRSTQSYSKYRVIIGGAILGAGMAIGGTCPTMIWVLIGSLGQNVQQMVVGVIVGGIVFFVLDEQQDAIGGYKIHQEQQPDQEMIVDQAKQRVTDYNDEVQIDPSQEDDHKSVAHTNNQEIINNNEEASMLEAETKQSEPMEEIVERVEQVDRKPVFIDKQFNFPQWSITLILFVILVIAILVLEIQIPSSSEFPAGTGQDSSKLNVFTQMSWPPQMVGIIVGILQFPIRQFTDRGLNASISSQSLIATLMEILGFDSKQSLSNSEYSILQLSQQLIGLVLGSAQSAQLANQQQFNEGVSPLRGFICGFMVIFGSRYAGASTFGQMMTGLSEVNTDSILTMTSSLGTAFLVGQLLTI